MPTSGPQSCQFCSLPRAEERSLTPQSHLSLRPNPISYAGHQSASGLGPATFDQLNRPISLHLFLLEASPNRMRGPGSLGSR